MSWSHFRTKQCRRRSLTRDSRKLKIIIMCLYVCVCVYVYVCVCICMYVSACACARARTGMWFDRSIDFSVGLSVDRSNDWLNEWMIDWSIDWLIDTYTKQHNLQQSFNLQTIRSSARPGHCFPPKEGDGLLHRRLLFWYPLPHGTSQLEKLLQLLQPPFMAYCF